RTVHLETLEQQLQALDCVPASEHALVLHERLQKSWLLRIESAEAMAFYRSRNLESWLDNIDEMEGLSEQARAIEHRARQCLIEARNERWIGPLQTLMQDGPCLIAVGSIHLVGEGGLIARLRRDGYQVEAMPF
ncbi:MAG: TraB/GumN family protein, partial [Thermomonas sp.]|uniref:TraB/GumN family protein n=1 Tax=Thermomonas sp. TaxID=1971895 RepID=UPI0039E5FC86